LILIEKIASSILSRRIKEGQKPNEKKKRKKTRVVEK